MKSERGLKETLQTLKMPAVERGRILEFNERTSKMKYLIMIGALSAALEIVERCWNFVRGAKC